MRSSSFFQTCTILSFLSIWGAANLDCRLFLMIESKISENVNIVWPGVAHDPRVVWFPTSAANGEEDISSAHSKRQSGISISSIGWLGHLVKESWGHVHAFSGSSISEKYFSDSLCFLSHVYLFRVVAVCFDETSLRCCDDAKWFQQQQAFYFDVDSSTSSQCTDSGNFWTLNIWYVIELSDSTAYIQDYKYTERERERDHELYLTRLHMTPST